MKDKFYNAWAIAFFMLSILMLIVSIYEPTVFLKVWFGFLSGWTAFSGLQCLRDKEYFERSRSYNKIRDKLLDSMFEANVKSAEKLDKLEKIKEKNGSKIKRKTKR